MGILSSMYTGITGLQGQGEALSIYGDNIANANTVGFKTSRPEFQDVIAKSLKGLLGGNQIGRGTRLAAVNPVFAQGSIVQTESSTDLAITGDGFFVLDGVDGQSFSRNGAFHFDKDGKLINSDNFRVQGFLADENGKLTSKMGDLSVNRTVVDAKKTTDVNLFMNLDLRAEKAMEFDPARPDQTSHFATGVTVYDTAGTAHVLTVYFNKTDDGVWTWRAMAKGEEVVNGQKGQMYEQARGRLTFDTDGRLQDQVTERSSFQFNKGALPDQVINFNFGEDKAHGGAGLQVTQYGTASEAYKTLQDGYTAGTLAGLTFNDDGALAAIYTNGQTINLGQIALAKFENPEGLFKNGQNRYRESRLSGQPTIGAPSTGGRGRVSSKTIESSTTDIASEFINLMTAQRSFQANSKVVSTADEMMQEVINLKRN
ncbi:MAG: flagellar hook protein [Bdellovibrionales bacterium RIFOXYC1_FULL_54_43]|nr:MAG: flagellar hook protein [Bdellovibrionales bacterium RIFOXYC1_FULL_54_43]OFZ79754.1 MAG: flagellar hook protein [Bdellovibrionales bacterium RIFOXYD1_FULL_55_31]